ncbi:hypothetical protein [Tenacibaculum aestuariivivum]|uniref:hypothetical protein n=1 Tax=Tenacibaculum aestuariivivum TaxID=2006131 RepID=UPI003AB3A4EB
MLAIKAVVRFLSTITNIGVIICVKPSNINNTILFEKVLGVSDSDIVIKKEGSVLLRSVYSVNEIIIF